MTVPNSEITFISSDLLLLCGYWEEEVIFQNTSVNVMLRSLHLGSTVFPIFKFQVSQFTSGVCSCAFSLQLPGITWADLTACMTDNCDKPREALSALSDNTGFC